MRVTTFRLLALASLFAVGTSLSACSDDPSSPGGPGGSGSDSGSVDGGTATDRDASTTGLGEGGITGQVAQIRFVNAFAPAGAKSTLDIHARRSAGVVRVLDGLAYGAVSPHTPAPISIASDTALFVTEAGADPATVPERKIILRLDRDKRYTVVLSDTFKRLDPQPGDVADVLSHQLLDERNTRIEPVAGKASLFIFEGPLRSLNVPTNWAVVGRDCLPNGDVHSIDPGAVAFGLYPINPPGCSAAPMAAMAAPAQLAAGARYAVVPIGESTGEADIRLLTID